MTDDERTAAFLREYADLLERYRIDVVITFNGYPTLDQKVGILREMADSHDKSRKD